MKQLSAIKSSEASKRARTVSELVSSYKWSSHPLGKLDAWPETLKIANSLCLHSRYPMAVYWGKDFLLLYNDAWAMIHGDKHPDGLGKPAKEVWTDIWKIIEKPMKHVMRTGKGSITQQVMLPLQRRGFTEECYFDYTLNPIFNASHDPEGILSISYEITARVLSERRNMTLRHLSEKSLGAESPDEACILVSNILSEAPYDIAYASIYLFNGDQTALRLAATTSVEGGTKLTPQTVDLEKSRYVLPFATTIRTKKQHIVRDLNRNYALPGGAWDEPSRHAVLLPLIRPQSKEVYGVIVLGVSPRLVYDEEYRNYFTQLAELTSQAIGSAFDARNKLILEAREHEILTQLQISLSSGNIGVWSMDLEMRNVVADENLAKMFGVDVKKARQGLPPTAFTKNIHPDDMDKLVKSMEKSLKENRKYHEEFRLVTNGDTKWVMARGKAETDRSGRPVRFPGVIVDITDRKKIENALARTERRFKSLFDSNIIGVIVGTLDGTIYEANKTFLKMFGYTARDMKKGLPINKISATRSTGGTSDIFQRLRQHGESEPLEREYRRKDGTTIPVLIGAAMIGGTKDRFIAFMFDISEKKHLRELNKAKDEFISIASHQLRTPATGVKQYLGMILEGYVGPLNSRQMEILNTAYESNERQLTVVNDLLRVAQADAHEVRLNRKKLNMSKLTEDVLMELAHQFAEKEQSVNYDPPKKPALVMADEFYIRMVLENIIDNASKFTPRKKSISIDIKPGTKYLTIRVIDEGVGIRKRDMSKLFKKFSRIDNPMSTSAGGTGLGLYWVDKIVELHGGTIQAKSKFKEGSEFVIKLPTWYKVK